MIWTDEHFEMFDWRRAFKRFYQARAHNSSLCLVLSTHWASEGYWIESNPKDKAGEHIYRTLEEVKAFEARIERERAKSNALAIPLVT